MHLVNALLLEQFCKRHSRFSNQLSLLWCNSLQPFTNILQALFAPRIAYLQEVVPYPICHFSIDWLVLIHHSYQKHLAGTSTPRFASYRQEVVTVSFAFFSRLAGEVVPIHHTYQKQFNTQIFIIPSEVVPVSFAFLTFQTGWCQDIHQQPLSDTDDTEVSEAMTRLLLTFKHHQAIIYYAFYYI